MEAMRAETFYEADNPMSYTDEDHGIAAMMEHEAKAQQEHESRTSVTTDLEGLPIFPVSRKSIASPRNQLLSPIGGLKP